MEPSPERLHALLALMAASGQTAHAAVVARLEAAFGPIETWWRRRAAVVASDPSCGLLTVPALDRAAEDAHRMLTTLGWRSVEPVAVSELAAIPDPPPLLFVRGPAALPIDGVAMVGARRASAYGLRMTSSLAEGLAGEGVPVLSGLARGIDAAAHRAALRAGGVTVAVLGSGPDKTYPAEHVGLADAIAENGLLVTEFLPGTPPLPHHFPRRNRILAAMARVVVLVEARLRSGSLSTVKWAADLGRDVLVVPGPVDHELGEGPMQLLREGAHPVATVDDVLGAMGRSRCTVASVADPSSPEATVAIDDEGRRLLALLGGEGADLDTLLRLSGLPVASVMERVLELEVSGVLLRSEDGRTFRSALTKAGRGP